MAESESTNEASEPLELEKTVNAMDMVLCNIADELDVTNTEDEVAHSSEQTKDIDRFTDEDENDPTFFGDESWESTLPRDMHF